MKFFSGLLALILMGCASNTGVLQLAPNTYTVSVGVAGTGSVSGNDTKAKRNALIQANEYCSGKNKQILVENIKMNSTYAGSTSDLIFKCLTDEESKSQQNTQYRKDADIIIEKR
jgi:hypothetical protein